MGSARANDYREVIGKGKENMDKAFAKTRQLNDASEESAE